MIEGITISMTGGPQLEKALSELESKVAGSVARKALRDAARPILATVKMLTPVATMPYRRNRAWVGGGGLRSAMVSRVPRRRRPGWLAMVIGTKAGWFKGMTFYGGFQEWGWKTGKRGSANRRQIPGRHFVERAFGAARDVALNTLVAGLKAGIAQVAK